MRSLFGKALGTRKFSHQIIPQAKKYRIPKAILWRAGALRRASPAFNALSFDGQAYLAIRRAGTISSKQVPLS